jgi:Tfp pilus assembly protein PilF
MKNDIRTQIKNNMMLKETEELLKIWQTGDTDEWEEETFEIIKEILIQRLGYPPPESLRTKLSHILNNVSRYYQSGQFDRALAECNLAIQIAPESAVAYNHRGLIYDELGQKEKAIIDFQTALRLDPEMEDAQDNLISIEKEIEEEFHEFDSKQHLDVALDYVHDDEPEKAMEECNLAIQMARDNAIAYNYRGLIYDELGQRENALADFQAALRLDPEMEDARDNLISIEKEIEEEFQGSESKNHLDLALDYVYNDDPEKAMQECELARETLPNIVMAHNYLGIILQEMGQIEPAVKAYQNAVRFNPCYFPARENLINARFRLDEEQYRQDTIPEEGGIQEEQELIAETDEFPDIPASDGENPVPGWLYLDEKAILLSGWAGHRTRPGRSGYDPLDTDFESAHVEGVIFRTLIDKKFRSRNPMYLLLMSFEGFIFCIPILWFIILIISQEVWYWYIVYVLILYSPYCIAGIALLNNVYLSLRLEKADEYDEKGYVFY